MRKGQGLSITTIIVAALGLVVLVILFAITTGRLAIFAGAASECPGRCLLTTPPQGKTAAEVGAEAVTAAICNKDFERQVRGSYIARGKDSKDKPIICDACCVGVTG